MSKIRRSTLAISVGRNPEDRRRGAASRLKVWCRSVPARPAVTKCLSAYRGNSGTARADDHGVGIARCRCPAKRGRSESVVDVPTSRPGEPDATAADERESAVANGSGGKRRPEGSIQKFRLFGDGSRGNGAKVVSVDQMPNGLPMAGADQRSLIAWADRWSRTDPTSAVRRAGEGLGIAAPAEISEVDAEDETA